MTGPVNKIDGFHLLAFIGACIHTWIHSFMHEWMNESMQARTTLFRVLFAINVQTYILILLIHSLHLQAFALSAATKLRGFALCSHSVRLCVYSIRCISICICHVSSFDTVETDTRINNGSHWCKLEPQEYSIKPGEGWFCDSGGEILGEWGFIMTVGWMEWLYVICYYYYYYYYYTDICTECAN